MPLTLIARGKTGSRSLNAGLVAQIEARLVAIEAAVADKLDTADFASEFATLRAGLASITGLSLAAAPMAASTIIVALPDASLRSITPAELEAYMAATT